MANTSGDLYLLRHIPIKGDGKKYVYGRLIGKLDCHDLATAEFKPGIQMQVVGCIPCERDMLHDAAVLDPFGDQEYAIEMRYGKAVPMQRCRCKTHLGSAIIPAVEFIVNDPYCRRCRNLIDGLLPPPPKPVSKTSYMKAFRADGRRKVALAS